jgi:hypothetical protein
MPTSPLSATAQQSIDIARRRFLRLSANGIYPGIKYQPQSIVASQVEAASGFLSLLTPTKTPRVCSYALKHAATAGDLQHSIKAIRDGEQSIPGAPATTAVPVPALTVAEPVAAKPASPEQFHRVDRAHYQVPVAGDAL